jgi:transposase
VMLYAAIDIHKQAFQAAVLDPDSGEVVEERFSADRESLARWAEPWRGRVGVVAIEATTGWRWVWRELAAIGFDVRLAEPLQAREAPPGEDGASGAARFEAELERSAL